MEPKIENFVFHIFMYIRPSFFIFLIYEICQPGLQKTDFLPVQTDFYFVKPIQFA